VNIKYIGDSKTFQPETGEWKPGEVKDVPAEIAKRLVGNPNFEKTATKPIKAEQEAKTK